MHMETATFPSWPSTDRILQIQAVSTTAYLQKQSGVQ